MTTSITSDRDYLEIVADGDITISTGTGSDSDAESFSTGRAGSEYGVATITHGAGGVPAVVRAFYDPAKNGRYYSGLRFDSTFGYQLFSEPWLLTVSTTTTTKLIIESFSVESAIPIYYRIYRFGTKSVTSDERIDKVFTDGTDEKTLSSTPSSDTPVVASSTIPHGQGEWCPWTLQFSEDGNTWQNEGTPLYGAPDTSSGPPGGPYARYYYTVAYGSSDATNFYVHYSHNYSTSKTIYVRYVLDYKV